MNRGRRIWRTARNLLCALLAGAALLLLAAGGPPVSREEAFRRLQREQFFRPYAQYQGTVTVGDRDWGVGLTDRWLLLGDMEHCHLYPWRRQGDGPAAAPVDCQDRETGAVCFLAAGAPEGTASARLELSLSCWYAVRASALPEDPGRLEIFAAAEGGVWRPGEEPAFWTKTYTLEGEPLEPGAFAFWLTPEGTDPVEERALGAACTWRLYWWEEYRENPDLQPVRCTAVAVFYDRAGNELGRAELTDIQGGV